MPKLLSLAIGLALISLLFSPLFGASSSIIPSTYPDASEVIWAIFFNQSYLKGEVPHFYETKTIFHPFGSSLFLHATVESITLPLAALLGHLSPERIYSIACALCFFLNFGAALRLFSAFNLSWTAGTVLSIAITFHPYFVARLDGGHLNFLCFFPVLLLLHSIILFNRGSRSKQIIAQGCIAGSASVFTNPYYLYMSGVLCCAWALYTLKTNRAAIYTYCTVILSPFLIGASFGVIKIIGALTLSGSRTYTSDHNPTKHSADIVSFMLPGVHQWLGDRYFSEIHSTVSVNSAERGAYIGLSLLFSIGLLLLTGKREKKTIPPIATWCFVVTAVAFWMSLGPQIQWRGEELIANYFFTVARWISPLMLSVPARFSIIAILHLLVAFAVLFENNHSRLRYLTTVLIIALLAEYMPAPIKTRDTAVPPILATLRNYPEIVAVHDFSSDPWSAMLGQIHHGKRITTAFISRRPKVAVRAYARNPFLAFISTGRAATPEAIAQGLEELDIQALIVPKEMSDVRRRLSDMGISIPLAEDDRVMVFRTPESKEHQPGL